MSRNGKRQSKLNVRRLKRVAQSNGPATAKLGADSDALKALKISLVNPKPAIHQGKVTFDSGFGSQRSPKKLRLKPATQERLTKDFEAHMAEKTAKAEKAAAISKREVAEPKPLLGVSSKPAKNKPQEPSPSELRKPVAVRLREVVEASSPELDERPVHVSPRTTEQIESALREGAKILRENPDPDLDSGFIVGFDLGTSSLKVAIRQPYQAGDPAVALTAPIELRSDSHPNLWQSVIWFDPREERFALHPTLGSIALGGFKTGIIGGYGDSRVLAGVPVTRAEAATAFMALQFAYLMGRYRQTRPLGYVGGDHFLGIHIGIPVAAHDDRKTFSGFSKVAAAAFGLAPLASTLRLEDVRSGYQNAAPQLPAGLKLVPELIAAIAGYAVEPTAHVGAHILVDVGASTLDIVAFNLIQRARVAVFNAGVDLLGAAALDVARTAGIKDDDFKRACDALFARVYGLARSGRRAPSLFDPVLRRQPVQLITTGGGCATELHQKFINRMPQPNVLGDLSVTRPTPPAGIVADNCDHSRLLLAFGLTRDEPELLDLLLPSEIEDLAPRIRVEIETVSKDHV